MIHKEQHPLAGKTVKIKATSTHRQFLNFGGGEFRIEDYWDRLGQGSWMFCDGNPACLIYALRTVDNKLPHDNEVVYGKFGAFGALLHVSEIDESN